LPNGKSGTVSLAGKVCHEWASSPATTMAERSDGPVSSRWRPLPGGVQNARNAHRVAGHVINHNVICVGHQFARTGNTTRPANVGVHGQLTNSPRESRIERKRRWDYLG
jgi:hypothetical protein